MYTVYDFINKNIESKHMKCGWKIEITPYRRLGLTYTMLNFDWKSLQFLNEELFNMFLLSTSYKTMKDKLDKARKKYNRLYFDANSIEYLKMQVEENKLKIDIDKLISKTIQKKSKAIIENNKNKSNNRDSI